MGATIAGGHRARPSAAEVALFADDRTEERLARTAAFRALLRKLRDARQWAQEAGQHGGR